MGQWWHDDLSLAISPYDLACSDYIPVISRYVELISGSAEQIFQSVCVGRAWNLKKEMWYLFQKEV